MSVRKWGVRDHAARADHRRFRGTGNLGRRIPTIVVLGGIVLAVLAVSGCGSGSSGSSIASTSPAEDTTLTVYYAPATNHSVDNPPSGPSVGDLEMDVGILLTNPYKTNRIGSTYDVCYIMSKTRNVYASHCTNSITIAKKGTLYLTGNLSASDHTLAITGGTGAYDESRGQVTFAPSPGDDATIKIDIDR
jgi:hypothetical protein